MALRKREALTAGLIIALAAWGTAASERRPEAFAPAPDCCQRWHATRQCQERLREPRHRCLDWRLVPKLRCAKSGRTTRAFCSRRNQQGVCISAVRRMVYRCVRYQRAKRRQCFKWQTKNAWQCLKYRIVRRCLQRAPSCPK